MIMNIFVVNLDPVVSAKELPDIYTGSANFGGKMIVETAQMLANAYSLTELMLAPYTQKGTPRKHSYLHHPCSKWVLESSSNFEWLLSHGISLCEEKLDRGGPRHFTNDFIDWCSEHPPDLEDKGLTTFAMAMPEEYKNEDVCKAYQSYLRGAKQHLKFTWTNTQTPEWYL